ncbi:MAG: hypothetical protein AAFO07_30320 [Bacteroidota bacterium]
MTDVLFVTASSLPRPDVETIRLLKLIEEKGKKGDIKSWENQSVDWSACKLCIIRSPWDYFTKIDAFTTWLEHIKGQTMIWNPVDIISWNINKKYLLELSQKGISVVPTLFVEKGDNRKLEKLLSNDFTETFIIKPAVSASAFQTKKFSRVDPIANKHLSELVTMRDVLLQPFIPEILEVGENSLIFFFGQFSHAIKKSPKTGDFRIQSEFGGTITKHIPSEEEMELAKATLKALPTAVAYARVDIVTTKNGPLLMELELIEPQLFLDFVPEGREKFAQIIVDHL